MCVSEEEASDDQERCRGERTGERESSQDERTCDASGGERERGELRTSFGELRVENDFAFLPGTRRRRRRSVTRWVER